MMSFLSLSSSFSWHFLPWLIRVFLSFKYCANFLRIYYCCDQQKVVASARSCPHSDWSLQLADNCSHRDLDWFKAFVLYQKLCCQTHDSSLRLPRHWSCEGPHCRSAAPFILGSLWFANSHDWEFLCDFVSPAVATGLFTCYGLTFATSEWFASSIALATVICYTGWCWLGRAFFACLSATKMELSRF